MFDPAPAIYDPCPPHAGRPMDALSGRGRGPGGLAAGDNVSAHIERLANLLQVSSPMGRAMESIDREAMSSAIYPVLQGLDLWPAGRTAVIAATAEGYSFPTNLDRDPPLGGLAPETMAAMMARMLNEDADATPFGSALDAWTTRRLP